MKLFGAKLWIGAGSLCGVLWLVYLDLGRTSPGPISRTHGQAEELLGRSGCDECHGGFRESLDEACATCHEDVGEHVRDGLGLHGTLAGVEASDCGRCHLEHHGEGFALVTASSFSLAGVPDEASFDHAVLEFTLGGKHLEIGCEECHPNASVPLLPAGERRYLGIEQRCDSCHEDVHEGSIVRACADCHGQEHPFAELATFAHERFETEGAHAAPVCQECHPADSPRAVEALAGAGPVPPDRECRDCHESPHAEELIAGASALSALPDAASCELCHAATHEAFEGDEAQMTPELHAAGGFSLDAPHDAVGCEDCHGLPETPFEERFPGRDADGCAICHEDPHGGQFDAGPFAAAGCLACHERHRFAPPNFDLDAHERTAFPLEDSHQAVACSQCHARDPEDAPRRFAGTAADCASCHTDAHRGLLVEAEGCAACHDATLFAAVDREAFDHAARTSYALEGAHAWADCEACHAPSSRADEHGRSFGFAHELFGRPVDACVTCHADPHAGRFDQPELPRSIDGRDGCARCHGEVDFREVQPELLARESWHEIWTGYPMAEFHAGVSCEECHGRSETPDELGRTLGAAPTACADCHTDPHVGQFVVAGRSDCARCHADAGELLFDHQRDSRFPLDESHALLECSACHLPSLLADGTSAVRYRPLGTTCVDCHGPGDPPRRKSR